MPEEVGFAFLEIVYFSLNQKNLLMRILTLVLLLCTLLTASACKKKDRCDELICQNNGVCSNGLCYCDTGYEGSDCGTAWNEKYIGTWHTASQSCTTGSLASFEINITPGSSPKKIVIRNLYGANYDTYATIEPYTISIPMQSLGSGTISGIGTVNENEMILYYNISSGGFTDECGNVVFHKY